MGRRSLGWPIGVRTVLSALPLVARPAPSAWRHDIRAVDNQGRFRLREGAGLVGFDGALYARLRPLGWELRVAGTGTRVGVDPQGRATIPVDVRHQLGIDGTAIVSLHTDTTRIVVWPSSRSDPFLEETQP